MAGWDEGAVHFVDQGLVGEEIQYEGHVVQQRFYTFLREFRYQNIFIYREQLRRQCRMRNFFIEVDLVDLMASDAGLVDMLKDKPTSLMPELEKAATQLAKVENMIQLHAAGEAVDTVIESEATHTGPVPLIQVILNTEEKALPIRTLTAVQIASIVVVQGIVVSASRTRPKAIKMTIMCSNCNATMSVSAKEGYSHVTLPLRCNAQRNRDVTSAEDQSCPLDPYVILPDRCEYVDCQTLKLQESPETIPTGEMPRHVILSCERYLVDRVVPGTRVTVIGVYTTIEGGKGEGTKSKKNVGGIALRTPYVHALGIRIDDPTKGTYSQSFTPEEEEEFGSWASRSDIYQIITQSIAPAIYGLEDVKKAIACQLFGGSRKHLPDGMRLRGDINVLLLGDPGDFLFSFIFFFNYFFFFFNFKFFLKIIKKFIIKRQ
jgi:DNA replication licensing factor MCM5